MEKYFIRSERDLEAVKEVYKENQEWIELIDEAVKKYPCVLLASYSDDVEFGEYYQFEVVTIEDFECLFNKVLQFSPN